MSFVVLNWHNELATLACVASIHAQRATSPYEVIVVDNDSTPESRMALGQDGFRLVTLEGNRGFTGGMNAGAAHARGELIALLNNDARLPEEWLSVAERAIADPQVGILGGPTRAADGESLASTLPRLDPRGFSELLAVQQPRRDVASVDGSHLVIRSAAWRALGGFDDRFFAYYEEADLCARALARGWRVIYEPELWVWHRRGLSSDRTRWRRTFWARRNRAVWVAKHFPARSWRPTVLAAAADYVHEALATGSTHETAADAVLRRTASLAAAAWVISHGRGLAAARRATIAAGEHDPRYRERLARLYEPPPLAPVVADPS